MCVLTIRWDFNCSSVISGNRTKMMDVVYRPVDPTDYDPGIALIGCGGITEYHLQAYRDAGYRVLALCDLNREAAENRAKEYFPDADIYTDYAELLRRDDIEVVDIATHPPQRPDIVRAAIQSRKHVLSQKPFVLDLDVGHELVELAHKCDVKLAVNQNGRWSPHFSYMRAAVAAGLLGDIAGVHMSVHWDHTWTEGTEFEKVKHLILYDFAIHWFDMINCLIADPPRRVFASMAKTRRQKIMPPLLAQAIVEFDHAQASLAFDADTYVGPNDRVFVTGTRGSIRTDGPSYQDLTLTMDYLDGETPRCIQPELEGRWFPDGFHGTMGELLCSIEEKREPTISAENNLRSLAICFAAVASAETGLPQVPGSVTRLPV